MCIQAGGGMGDNAASALFLLRFGADFLPYMYMALGGLNFILALAYATGLGRFKRNRFFIWLLAGFAILLLIERAAILRPFSALYPILWLTISGISLVLGTFIWNLAGEVCDTRQAKRLFPLFTSAGILGSVLGNSITGLAAKIIGTENLLILQSTLLGLALFLTYRISRGYFKPAAKSAKHESLLTDLRVGFDFVRGSSLMKLIAYASILFSILFFGIAFPFNKVVSTSFPDEARVAGFLGLFSSLTTATTFLVSLFIANRLYARLGIVNSVLLLPITYIFGFGFFAYNYNLTGAVTARFLQMVMLSGAADSGWNALFNVVPSQKRGQVLAFQNGLPSQIGVVLSGILLILGEKILTTPQIFFMCGFFALVCGAVVWRMRAAYGEALIAALRAGRVEVFSAREEAFAGVRNDPFAISVAAQSLHDPKPTTRRLAAEILGKMNAVSAVPALRKALPDPDASVRRTIIEALGKLNVHDSLADIVSCLDDTESDVRISALIALPQITQKADANLLAKLENLLDDKNIKVRLRAALVLAKFGAKHTVSTLMNWLNSGEHEQRLAALETLGEFLQIAKANGNTLFAIQPVVSALNDPSPSIRKAACCALRHAEDGTAIENLIKCLSDSDTSVRQAAVDSLRELDLSVRPRVIQVLQSNNGHAQEAALEILSPDQPETRQALLNYVHQESSNVRTLRRLLIGLADDGRSIDFLRDILRARLTVCEKHLIKTVGLFGNPQTMELVRKSLHERDAEGRAAALETLETLGDKQLVREIMPLLEGGSFSDGKVESSSNADAFDILLSDHDPWVRALTSRAIAELDQRAFIPRLHELKLDKHELVAASAREVLIQFGEESPVNTLQTISTLERILLLREVPIFADLSPEDLEQVAEIAREQWFPDGAILCRAGEDGNAMYIIVSGQVQVRKEAGGVEKVLATRGVGDFVGEMAIIDSAPRMATLIAQGELRVLVIYGDAFTAILRDRSDVSISVMRALSRRLREMPL